MHVVNFENLLLSVFYYFLTEFKCSLLRPVNCAGRAIHAFPNKMRRPKCFRLRLNSMSHPLSSSCSASVSVLILGPVVHVCNSVSGSTSVRLLFRLGSPCSAERQQLHAMQYRCTYNTLKVHDQCAQGMRSLEL